MHFGIRTFGIGTIDVMTARNSSNTLILTLSALLVLGIALIGVTEEDSAAVIVLIICLGLASIGSLFVQHARTRQILTGLFLAAFALRVVLTYAAYKTGMSNMLAGGDESNWLSAWRQSRTWQRHSLDPNVDFSSETMRILFTNIRANRGYFLFSTVLFSWLDVRSQLALAFTNCFASALTVVVIYQVARDFFSEKASLFAAKAAIFLPCFLVWSMLAIKESWLILFEISIFFFIWRLWRDKHPLYAVLIIALAALIFTFRFYIAWISVAGIVISLACFGSQRPFRALCGMLVVVAAGGILLNAAGMVSFDPVSIAQSRISEFETFREGLSSVKAGANTVVNLGFDLRTPSGIALSILTGAAYLLLSPFPWELFNGRQIYALPDVLMWWWLVFAFIVPGLRYSWRHRQSLLISILAFTLPLILFYALIFGNVGLAYRQRAQIMPFLLILAAAGYQARRQKAPSKAKHHPGAIALLFMPRQERLRQPL